MENRVLPPYKWPPLPWYIKHIQKGNYTVVHDKKTDKYAVQVNNEIVSPWQSKQDITHRVKINYNVVLDFSK